MGQDAVQGSWHWSRPPPSGLAPAHGLPDQRDNRSFAVVLHSQTTGESVLLLPTYLGNGLYVAVHAFEHPGAYDLSIDLGGERAVAAKRVEVVCPALTHLLCVRRTSQVTSTAGRAATISVLHTTVLPCKTNGSTFLWQQPAVCERATFLCSLFFSTMAVPASIPIKPRFAGAVPCCPCHGKSPS